LGLELKAADSAAKKRQWGKARDLCREAVRNNPANFLAALRAGEISVTNFRDPEAGIRELEAAVRAGPTEWYLHYSLGFTYALAGRKADAVRSLTRALVLEPKAGQVRELLESLRKPPA
jgi:predicted Zn-dependent protease